MLDVKERCFLAELHERMVQRIALLLRRASIEDEVNSAIDDETASLPLP